MRIHVKKTDTLVVPTTATPHSSGYDVIVLEEPKIVGVQTDDLLSWKSIDYIEYHTGLFIAPQVDTYGLNYHTLIFPRSSVRKYNLILANSIGLIDNDYRGEVILCFKYIWQPEDYVIRADPNEERSKSFTKISDTVSSLNWQIVGNVNKNKIYKKGDKIGQLVSEVANHADYIVVADLSETLRGQGGFGSTTEVKKKVTLSQEHPVESPKEASRMLERFKAATAEEPVPEKYESIAKEREKLIP